MKQDKLFGGFHNILRKISVAALYLIFVYWASQALLKYFSEPTNTDIKYELGEDGRGNSFPLITFCNHDQMEQEMFFQEHCGLIGVKDKDYFQLVKDCLESNDELDLNSLMDQLQIQFNGSLSAHLYSDTVTWEDGIDIAKTMWETTFHPVYGYCDTFYLKHLETDISKKHFLFPDSWEKIRSLIYVTLHSSLVVYGPVHL